VVEGLAYKTKGVVVARGFAFVIEGEGHITIGRPTSMLERVGFRV